jgi:hypothetical protein
MHHRRGGISGAALVVGAVGRGTERRARWTRVENVRAHADRHSKARIDMVQIIVRPSVDLGKAHCKL